MFAGFFNKVAGLRPAMRPEVTAFDGMRYKVVRLSKNKECLFSEAVFRVCSVKKVFLEISQNSQGNTCARDSFLMKFIKTLLKKRL